MTRISCFGIPEPTPPRTHRVLTRGAGDEVGLGDQVTGVDTKTAGPLLATGTSLTLFKSVSLSVS